MPTPATFETFEAALRDHVARFAAGAVGFFSRQYDEASLRQDFLNPLFRDLGWDLENNARLILKHREVEIESRTIIAGRKKRADYLFRTDTRDRFVCEAKKPAESMDSRYAFQAKRYGWNKEVPIALLSDFEELCIYIVAARPALGDAVEVGLWKKWHYTEYPANAREIWNLLSREAVAGGSIDRLLDTLPKKPSGKGRARQLWLIRPNRSRALDSDFLIFLDEARRTLGSDLLRHNPAGGFRENHARLNEAVQCILDRLLFLRICEDRDIDTGTNLRLEVENWRSAIGQPSPSRARQSFLPTVGEEPPPPSGSPNLSTRELWPSLVAHFRALDRRPASHVPFFNGHLFKPHFIEDLTVGDDWLATFLDDLSSDESPYLFAVIPVEILGTVYERFLGKVIRPQGLGVTIEEKPEVRKAGGVYYTPRYIVDYIVEQTVGQLLEGQLPEKTAALRFLDPACGSGSFLIRVFERVCEHWLEWLTANPKARKKNLCWTEDATGDVHLTAALKRRILTANIYGVDLDPGAVEVTQLSLYLKMLEGENRNTLARERELFSGEDEPPLLPPLANNIKCGNSLIASDFSLDPDELVRVRAFDWHVQFPTITKEGGFDAVVGNPPYIQLSMAEFRDDEANAYLKEQFGMSGGRLNTFALFIEKARNLCKLGGHLGQIVPNTLLTQEYYEESRIRLVTHTHIIVLAQPRGQVFGDAVVENIIVVARTLLPKEKTPKLSTEFSDLTETGLENRKKLSQSVFSANYKTSFIVPADPELAALRDRLSTSPQKFGDCLHINQAIALKHDRAACLTQTKLTAKHHEILDGRHIGRYFTGDSPNYFKFDVTKIHSCKREDIFLAAEKIFMRRVGDSLIGTLDTEQKFGLNTLVVLTPKENCVFELRFLLGLFNSKLINFYYTSFLKSTKKVFSEIQARQVAQLPIPNLTIDEKVHRARNNRFVALVDKMLALTPRLRAAKGDHERATLQNAVTATDHQIDQLVYELYALTPEEITLVEGPARA